MQTTTSVITLPSIKELFNDQRISVESRNHSACIPSCKLPTLSLSIPCPKFQLASPTERNVDDSMTGYHHKGNQYQNDLLRLPSISTMGQMGDSNNNNRNVVTSVQKHSRPNSIQSLISPPESPDMINNPSFEDHETHPRLAHPEHHYPSNAALLSTPRYQAQTYVPEQHRYDRVGGYRQERVVYDHSYTEQRAYPSSKTSPTTLQPAFSPYESRPVTTPPTLNRLDIPSSVSKNVNTIPRRLSPKIVNDQQLALPVSGGPSSNNRYQCPYCSKRFSRPSSLRIHTYSHTGEKPFVCTESGCGRKFSVQSNMRRHLRVHRLGRPVKKVRYDGEVEGVKMLNHGPIMRSC